MTECFTYPTKLVALDVPSLEALDTHLVPPPFFFFHADVILSLSTPTWCVMGSRPLLDVWQCLHWTMRSYQFRVLSDLPKLIGDASARIRGADARAVNQNVFAWLKEEAEVSPSRPVRCELTCDSKRASVGEGVRGFLAWACPFAVRRRARKSVSSLEKAFHAWHPSLTPSPDTPRRYVAISTGSSSTPRSRRHACGRGISHVTSGSSVPSSLCSEGCSTGSWRLRWAQTCPPWLRS